MSDPDATPDPIDKAYVDAEAVLSDEAARAARRARVLGAVARQAAPEAAAPGGRSRLWRRGGWLVAASVSGLALAIASQLFRPPAFPPPSPLPAAPALSKGPAAERMSSPPAEAAASPTPPASRAARPDAERPTVEPSAAAQYATPLAPTPSASDEPAPAAPPPPPPPPSADSALSDRAAPVPPQAQAKSADGGPDNGESVSELVVTGVKRESRRSSSPGAISAFAGRLRDAVDPGARLRAASADGRVADVERLLKHGAPTDAPDAEGDTALMKSIQADHPAVAALLRRSGASLDRRNQAGESARDMARAIGDPALDRAIGLER
jgi:hypothetical protein